MKRQIEADNRVEDLMDAYMEAQARLKKVYVGMVDASGREERKIYKGMEAKQKAKIFTIATVMGFKP